MKILIIDDDRNLREAVQMMIVSLGGEADVAAGAEEALQRLDTAKYDFILLDMKMSEKDGMWFMRRAEIPCSTRVILMSAFVPGMLMREMYRLGVCDYLEKPFDAQDLLDAIERQSKPKAHCDSLSQVAA